MAVVRGVVGVTSCGSGWGSNQLWQWLEEVTGGSNQLWLVVEVTHWGGV